ncbi:RNA polymerase sigma-54 factor, partial [Candidatus Saccharibacteria bacterium]|nr:RNA polymerase sigma-54 factor [Candidatus Saccharibacteria bacterium]
MYRVTESILKFQKNFFEKGVSHLNPLNLKDVAQELEMHESTISRATSNKYLSCSHGLFNFRYFFSSGLKTDNGSVSSTSVK